MSKANQYARDHGKTPFVVYQGRWNVLARDFERDIRSVDFAVLSDVALAFCLDADQLLDLAAALVAEVEAQLFRRDQTATLIDILAQYLP